MLVAQEDYIAFLRGLADGSVDLVLTDPPFGIDYQNNYTHKMQKKIENDGSSFSYELLAKESYRVLKDDSASFFFTGWSTYAQHYVDIAKAGFKMREPLICQKRPAGSTGFKSTFQANSDWIIFVTKGKFKFRETKILRNKRAGTIPNKGRKPVPEWKNRFPSCWFGKEFPFSTENPSYLRKHDIVHPTVKSHKLLSWIIQLTTDPGGLVIDPFCGSGSLALAALNTRRDFAVCDVKEEYVRLTNKRLQEGF